jgi:hypothetical protein
MEAFYTFILVAVWNELRLHESASRGYLLTVYLTTLSVAHYTASSSKIKHNWKAYVWQLSWSDLRYYLDICLEGPKKHEKSQSEEAVSGPRFETGNCRIRSKSANHLAVTSGRFPQLCVCTHARTHLCVYVYMCMCAWAQTRENVVYVCVCVCVFVYVCRPTQLLVSVATESEMVLSVFCTLTILSVASRITR